MSAQGHGYWGHLADPEKRGWLGDMEPASQGEGAQGPRTGWNVLVTPSVCVAYREGEQLPTAAQVHPAEAMFLPRLRGRHSPAASQHDQAPLLPLDV